MIVNSFLKIFFATVLLFIYNCTTTPNEDYIKLSEIPEANIMKEIPEAIQNTEVIEVQTVDAIGPRRKMEHRPNNITNSPIGPHVRAVLAGSYAWGLSKEGITECT